MDININTNAKVFVHLNPSAVFQSCTACYPSVSASANLTELPDTSLDWLNVADLANYTDFHEACLRQGDK